jgi:hypothetical protein
MPLLLLFLAACDPADDAAAPDTAAADLSGALDPALFLAEGLAADIRTEACTLSGGTTTTCYRIEVHSLPTEHDVGPFCPRSVTDDARVTGIWIEDGAVFDASGAFIEGLATFYDCGGHVNLHAGYHYHAATGCPTEVAQSDAHAPLIGYALDGYGLYAMLDTAGTEPSDLDECHGHADATRGYHYHVASPGENMFIGCFHGEQGEREGGEGPPP